MLALLLVNLNWRIQLASRSHLVFPTALHEFIPIDHSILLNPLRPPQQQPVESDSVLINSPHRGIGTVVDLAQGNGKKVNGDEERRMQNHSSVRYHSSLPNEEIEGMKKQASRIPPTLCLGV